MLQTITGGIHDRADVLLAHRVERVLAKHAPIRRNADHWTPLRHRTTWTSMFRILNTGLFLAPRLPIRAHLPAGRMVQSIIEQLPPSGGRDLICCARAGAHKLEVRLPMEGVQNPERGPDVP